MITNIIRHDTASEGPGIRRACRVLAGVCAAGACMMALAACSSSSSGAPGATAGAGEGSSSTDATAKRFAACLTGRGFDARTASAASVPGLSPDASAKGSGTKDAVELRMIDASGDPVGVGDASGGITSDASGADQLYANAAYTSVEDDSKWVVFRDASGLAGSPYAGKQADYAACEKANPDFSQPVPDSASAGISEDDKRAALDFAAKARAKGFGWVRDPDGDAPTAIVIPSTVSESELRRFLKACPTDGRNISFAFEGTTEDYGYDYNKVLDEATPAQ